jgi:hypothetical protein
MVDMFRFWIYFVRVNITLFACEITSHKKGGDHGKAYIVKRGCIYGNMPIKRGQREPNSEE